MKADSARGQIVRIEYLAERPEHIGTLAAWHRREWGHLRPRRIHRDARKKAASVEWPPADSHRFRGVRRKCAPGLGHASGARHGDSSPMVAVAGRHGGGAGTPPPRPW